MHVRRGTAQIRPVPPGRRREARAGRQVRRGIVIDADEEGPASGCPGREAPCHQKQEEQKVLHARHLSPAIVSPSTRGDHFLRHYFGILVVLLAAQAMLGGVRKLSVGAGRPNDPIDLNDSAALFVGVRKFDADETLTEVRYAADDAVDLAYLFSMEPATRLVAPSRVVLALSGEPQKLQSQDHLKALLKAGATRIAAGQADLLKALRMQAGSIRNNGILIASFATHGINVEGTQYLLAQSSLLQDRETAVSETKVRDIVENAHVPRALIR